MGEPPIGSQLNRAIETGQRFILAVREEQRQGALKFGFGKLGLQPNRCVVKLNRRFVIVFGVRVLGAIDERLAASDDGLIEK